MLSAGGHVKELHSYNPANLNMIYFTESFSSENSCKSFFALMPGGYLSIVCMFLFGLLYSSSLYADQTNPQRIITLSPHLAELVYLLGAGEQLSGVVESSDYPLSVKNIPKVGGASGLDVERILSINPDLILAWQGGSRETEIQKLTGLGLRVVSIKSSSLEDIPDSLNEIGVLLNKQQQATFLINNFNENRALITERYKNQPSHRIFIEISSQPLMGLTNLHPFGAALALCGLENIFSDVDNAAIITDLESILSRNVDYVLLRQNETSDDNNTRKDFYRINDDSDITFISFDENMAFRQTPRLLDAVEQVCTDVLLK